MIYSVSLSPWRHDWIGFMTVTTCRIALHIKLSPNSIVVAGRQIYSALTTARCIEVSLSCLHSFILTRSDWKHIGNTPASQPNIFSRGLFTESRNASHVHGIFREKRNAYMYIRQPQYAACVCVCVCVCVEAEHKLLGQLHLKAEPWGDNVTGKRGIHIWIVFALCECFSTQHFRLEFIWIWENDIFFANVIVSLWTVCYVSNHGSWRKVYWPGIKTVF